MSQSQNAFGNRSKIKSLEARSAVRGHHDQFGVRDLGQFSNSFPRIAKRNLKVQLPVLQVVEPQPQRRDGFHR